MLEAIFSEGITTVTVTGLTQWDYGRKLTIKGLSYTDNVEVHFSNNIEKEAVVMEVTKSGSDLVTEVPNVLLEKNHDITAWVYIDSGTSGETVRTINLKVKPRIKPADYISENNAGKVIDYVDEAKELLENATEQADRLDEIVDRVPDFDSYEKLAEHDHLLYDGLYVSGETYSGVASNKGMKLHSVKGKTEQQTTTGKNILPNFATSRTHGGVTYTVNSDKSITIKGTASGTSFVPLIGDINDYKQEVFKVDEDYVASGIYAGKIILSGRKTTGEYITIYSQEYDCVDIKGMSFGAVYIQVADGYSVDATVYPQIELGSEVTSYEPYTGGVPAPNPDYAMPIENVEISNITSHGRNLLPYPYYCGGIGIKNTQSGIDFEILPDKSFKLSGTATSACYINLSRIEYGDENFAFQNYVGLVGNTNEYITFSYNPNNKITSIYVAPNRAIDTIVYPMVSKGKQVPEWEAPTGYNTTSTNLTLAQDDVYQNNLITRARKQVTFDGSSDEGWSLQSINNYGLANFQISLNPISNGKTRILLSNRFKRQNSLIANTTEEGIYLNDINQLFIRIDKNRLSTQDTSGFRTWLSTHNTVVEYKLATPTTEEFKVPTIPSYYPYTNVSTDCNVETEIQYEILANSDNSLYQEVLEKRIEALEHAMLER
jgi:hypothetical protein